MLRVVISAGTVFLITSSGALLLALWSSRGQSLDGRTYLAACLIGIFAAASDVRSTMKMPPLKNGSGVTLNQIVKQLSTTGHENDNDQHD